VKHPLVSLLVGLVGSFCVLTVLLRLVDPDVESFRDAVFTVLPPFLGQVIENPDIPLHRALVSVVGLVASIGSLAIITALIVNRFVRLCMKGGRIVKEVRFRNHIVICGWNTQGAAVVDELLRADTGKEQRVVILADLDKRPIEEDRVEFLKGSPIKDTDLRRARIEDADSAIVLTDFAQDPNEADAKALLIVLAVESLNRSVHTCVQILNASNRRHFERVNTDEIICLEQLGANLAVASALNHGTSHLVSELLTFNSGSEFYRYAGKLPENLVGVGFAQAVHTLAERRIILLGIETPDSEEVRKALPDDIAHPLALEDEKRIIIVNPQGPYRLQQGDALFLVAEDLPRRL
ncbi:MAG: NAD-binding protein, partial [Candidatus Bipolaricaulia bacterium]